MGFQYRIDLFAVFILLGIVQAFFLCIFFFSRRNRVNQTNLFYGILMAGMGLNILEIFLMYTGYIIHALYLVDFSEPVSFVIGPAFYLMVLSMTRGRVGKLAYLHFIFALVYLVLVIPFFLLPEAVKFNSWIWSYEIDLPRRPYEGENGPRIFWLTDQHTLLALTSLVLYGLLSLAEVIRVFRARGESFFSTTTPLLRNLRTGTVQVALTTVLILVIKAFNPHDTGDHIFAAFIGVTIYITSFRVMSSSGFFKSTSLENPSGKQPILPDQELILERLRDVMNTNKPYLDAGFSLPELAQQVGVSVHVLSRVINSGLGKSFFEMTAEYRVNEARELLVRHPNIKVEEIASQVGYSSKSSFNTAFKKITGKTPSDYRDGY